MIVRLGRGASQRYPFYGVGDNEPVGRRSAEQVYHEQMERQGQHARVSLLEWERVKRQLRWLVSVTDAVASGELASDDTGRMTMAWARGEVAAVAGAPYELGPGYVALPVQAWQRAGAVLQHALPAALAIVRANRPMRLEVRNGESVEDAMARQSYAASTRPSR